MSETNSKPRICDILGVNVGDKFSLKYFDSEYGRPVVFVIEQDGTYTTDPPKVPYSSYYLLRAINNPELVQRSIKDSLTEEDKSFLKAMTTVGAKWISRDGGGEYCDVICFWRHDPVAINASAKEEPIFIYRGAPICSCPANELQVMNHGDKYKIGDLIELS